MTYFPIGLHKKQVWQSLCFRLLQPWHDVRRNVPVNVFDIHIKDTEPMVLFLDPLKKGWIRKQNPPVNCC